MILECGRRSGTIRQVTEQLGNFCQRGPGLIAFTCILLGDGDLNLPLTPIGGQRGSLAASRDGGQGRSGYR